MRQVVSNHKNWLNRFFERFNEGANSIGRTERLRGDFLAAFEAAGETIDKDLVMTHPPANECATKEPIGKECLYSLPLAEDVLVSEEKFMKRFEYEYVPKEVLKYE